MFVKNSSAKGFKLAEGINSKILGHGGNLMIVENRFNKGAIAPLHTHDHEQACYVVKGKFEFTIEDKARILEAGDSIYAGPNIPHKCIALEDGIIVDVFSPQREDFLERIKG